MMIQYLVLFAMSASLLVNTLPDTSADLDRTTKAVNCSIEPLGENCAGNGQTPQEILGDVSIQFSK